MGNFHTNCMLFYIRHWVTSNLLSAEVMEFMSHGEKQCFFFRWLSWHLSCLLFLLTVPLYSDAYRAPLWNPPPAGSFDCFSFSTLCSSMEHFSCWESALVLILGLGVGSVCCSGSTISTSSRPSKTLLMENLMDNGASFHPKEIWKWCRVVWSPCPTSGPSYMLVKSGSHTGCAALVELANYSLCPLGARVAWLWFSEVLILGEQHSQSKKPQRKSRGGLTMQRC